MIQKTMLASQLEAVGANACLDSSCKRLIANKIILAWIMQNVMEEYRDYDVTTIAERFIEGTPTIAAKAVHQDTKVQELVRGEDTVDKTVSEGTVIYDILFRAIIPREGNAVNMIINVEAQKDYYPGYPLVKRGIYYCCRMISSQYGTEFSNSHYEDINKVYSIWICIDPPQNKKYSISKYSITEQMLVGNYKETLENYDLLSAIIICLGETKPQGERQTLIDMLSILFSTDMNVKEKKKCLEENFGIKMTTQLDREVSDMCNYSEWVEEKGIEKGTMATLISLVRQGLLEIADAAKQVQMSESEFADSMRIAKS